MSNDNEQESDNELKVIGKIELKFKKLTGDDIVHAQNLYKILDKLVMDLNKAKLDNVLDKSINQLSNALAEEKSRLDEFITKVDNKLKGLQDQLDNMPDILEAPTSYHVTGEENGLF